MKYCWPCELKRDTQFHLNECFLIVLFLVLIILAMRDNGRAYHQLCLLKINNQLGGTDASLRLFKSFLDVL